MEVTGLALLAALDQALLQLHYVYKLRIVDKGWCCQMIFVLEIGGILHHHFLPFLPLAWWAMDRRLRGMFVLYDAELWHTPIISSFCLNFRVDSRGCLRRVEQRI